MWQREMNCVGSNCNNWPYTAGTQQFRTNSERCRDLQFVTSREGRYRVRPCINCRVLKLIKRKKDRKERKKKGNEKGRKREERKEKKEKEERKKERKKQTK
jgi:hypothetical protein